MKKQMLAKSFRFLLLITMTMGAPQAMGMCVGDTVLWHNLSDVSCPASTSDGIIADVVDQNIDIIGTNAIFEGIHVTAETCDILITVTNGDAVITGSGNRCDGVPSNPARLYLSVAAGRSIVFDLENSLAFQGVVDGVTPLDLLITITGGGIVNFALNDGSTVSFTSDATGTAGTQVYVGMGMANQPVVSFSRQNVDSADNVNVVIGARSYISYIAPDDVPGVGTIRFDPSNLNPNGYMILNIQNGGGFNIGGHLVNTTLTNDILLGDIDLSAVAGLSAILTVSNQQFVGPSAGILRIVNDNQEGCDTLLSDPFCQDELPGIISGFVLGPVGSIVLNDLTYLDYIGTTSNTCCTFSLLDDCGNPQTNQRLRNGSAFIVDGLDNTTSSTIQFLGSSAIYFRSGVDKCGDVSPTFTIDFALRTPCAGNIVFDVEGRLDVIGTPGFNSGLNILSLEVDPIGCPIVVGGTEAPLFPARTFATDANGEYIRYNAAAFLINNRVNLINTSLIHTDENHEVFEHDTLLQGYSSEPTYIGGDTYWLCDRPIGRPAFAFYNSILHVNTDLAATGVDWRVPNDPTGANNSFFIFYNNGFCIDRGYGRNMILGTSPCFEGCCYTSTDNSSHLDIFQESAQAIPTAQNLTLLAAANDACITEGLVGDISGQSAVQTIFLNHATNISIGTPAAVGTDLDGNTFDLTTTGQLLIDGSVFSFESLGGRALMPERSASTGQGGIFVDNLGALRLLNNRIANFGAMVVRSRGGVVDLPENGAFFDSRIGIADWQVDLTDPAQRILVDVGQSLSDYTLDWGAIIKDYCCTSEEDDCFIPYDSGSVPAVCDCPLVTSANLTALPEIRGTVQQLQIQRARIGDVPHININGGYVRELVFLPGNNSAEAPVAFMVLNNNAILGVGSAHKNVDSLDASIVFGINGVMLAPDGDSTVILNEDVIINNLCPIVTGTNFGLFGENTLTIRSVNPQKLLIKSTGVLDLGQFDTPDKVLNISGQAQLVAEPGARIVMGGGVLVFSENAEWVLTPQPNAILLTGTSANSLDDSRVRLSGIGNVIFQDDASMFVGQDSLFGVESYPPCGLETSIDWTLLDQASLQIGSSEKPGGAFQIGDTVTTPTEVGVSSINFNLTLDGEGALFQVDRQGFFGLAAGVADKFSSIPNDWLVSCLNNVGTISINVNEGTIMNDQIVDGSSALASLWAIGSAGSYNFTFDPVTSIIRAGGNMVQVVCTTTESFALNPTVTGFAGTVPGPVAGSALSSNIMASKPLLADKVVDTTIALIGGTATQLFNYLSTPNIITMPGLGLTPRANIAPDLLNTSVLGFVAPATVGSPFSSIQRVGRFRLLFGVSADPADPTESYEVGAVNMNFDAETNQINLTTQIQAT